MVAIIKRCFVWLSVNEVRRYSAAVGTNITIILIQLFFLFLSGSLALRSDTFHLGSDTIIAVGSLTIAVTSIRVNKKAEQRMRKWFAYAGIVLLMLGALHVQSEVKERMFYPVSVHSMWVLYGGIVGGLGNAFVLFILRQATDTEHNHTHNILSWHVFFDFLFSIAVIGSAAGAMWFNVGGIDNWVSDKLSFFMFLLGGFLFAQVKFGKIASPTKPPRR